MTLLRRPDATTDGPLLTVDPAAIGENVRRIRSVTAAEVMAVVKADGFGAGAAPVARAALAAGATWLGTATLDEAVALRDAGLAAPLLSWLHRPGTDWATAARLAVDVAVSSTAQLREAAAATRASARRLQVHLHVDVGLAREGASPADWPKLVAEAAALERSGRIRVVGVMGHLPYPEETAHPSTDAGIRRFEDAVGTVRAAGLRPALRHLAATQATLHHPATHFDLVRVGAALHGIGSGLRAVSTLSAPVVHTQRVAAGTPIGYGHTTSAARATVLAVLPVGYADGVPRRLDAAAGVQLDGRRCAVVGRVSMDQTIIDVGPEGCALGATATLFGSGERGEPVLHDWAVWAGTIEQDVLTGIGARVGRRVGGVR